MFYRSGDGYLKKVVIESDSSGVKYADIPIRPGHSVRPDILFDLKREHVYVMTDKKVSKVSLNEFFFKKIENFGGKFKCSICRF